MRIKRKYVFPFVAICFMAVLHSACVKTEEASPGTHRERPARTLDIDLVFLLENEAGTTSFLWPFETPSAGSLSSSITNGLGSYKGVETAFVLPEEEGGYRFLIKAQNGVAKHPSQGFRFAGVEGDYMELPAISGLALDKVTVTTRNACNVRIERKDGFFLAGGAIAGGNRADDGSLVWKLYGNGIGSACRLVLVSTTTASIARLTLHYTSKPDKVPSGSISPFDYGLGEATDGKARFNAISNAHYMAAALGKEVDYTGVGEVEMEIPSGARTIPIGKTTDFMGAVFRVLNNSKDICLFTMQNPMSPVSVTGAQVDASDYLAVPELSSGLHILVVQDENLWVEERAGRDYGVNRKDAILVMDGTGLNGPCAPYGTAATEVSATYCKADDDLKDFGNVSLVRDAASTFKTYLVRFEGVNNLRIHDVSVTTPEGSLVADQAIKTVNCTNVLMEDITVDGSYSHTDSYGYGISCNAVTWGTFRRITSNCNWGVFGCNNMHGSLVEDCHIERFDCHCYGRDVTMVRSVFHGPYGFSASSVYGTILMEECTFINGSIPYHIRDDYNTFVGFDLVLKDCVIEGGKPYIFHFGKLDDNLNIRPELTERCWPDIRIDGLTVGVPAGATDMYLVYLNSHSYSEPVGYMGNIDIKGLEFIYPFGTPTVLFRMSRFAVQLKGDLTCRLDGLKISSPGGSSPALIRRNITGSTDNYSITDSDARWE